jgi:hypothetical protein
LAKQKLDKTAATTTKKKKKRKRRKGALREQLQENNADLRFYLLGEKIKRGLN